MSAISIDFGSSNTVIARWNIATDQPETMIFEELNRPAPLNGLVPSLIYVQNAQTEIVEIGQRVIDQGKDRSQPRLFSQIKRRLAANVNYVPKLDGVKVTPEWLGSQFLREISKKLRSQQIFPSEIILTAPVQSYEKYLRWLEECSSAIFAPNLPTLPSPRIRILDEPTAAALGYEAIAPSALVLVIDFGGGTLDLSLVRLPKGENVAKWGEQIGVNRSEWTEYQAEAIAKTGYTIGGEDIDQWLVQDYLERSEDGTNGSETNNLNILKFLMERIKINLSEVETASEIFFDLTTQSTTEITYSRQQLEKILDYKGFYRVLQSAIDELINRAFNKGILKGDIKHILLVGGCTLIPSVVLFVEDYFKMGKVYSHKPFEAIAHGALMLSQGVSLQDYLFHSYAIRYWDRAAEQWKYQPLFRRGQVYPTRRPVELLLRATQPNQPEIALTIGEIESRPTGAAEVSFDGDRLVMQFDQKAKETFQPLQSDANGAGMPQAIALLDPLGQPDCDRLKVLFSISEKRELLVTAIDLLTQRQLLTNHPVAKLQ
ncbi:MULTISPECIES: Hsp70 family protein [Pseudanabaena]|uniref:Hsp70 family protein n=1 Tax=Pseudanabaena TaxID=1152 RepID=UPI00247AFEF9|nr:MULTISPECIES: Hsp70 family protein [Pseudanabaena]MEA5490211.1 Hsp70 family protein [Pseudanabaena sp. CCNP1317]WGS72454.1 Hsp70 family protein [Pseudanabaena galeata CCNP1313]